MQMYDPTLWRPQCRCNHVPLATYDRNAQRKLASGRTWSLTQIQNSEVTLRRLSRLLRNYLKGTLGYTFKAE